jgi:alpha/beta superfamily hydrolase
MTLRFQGPVGWLEGVLELPDAGEARGAAIVCHPHPMHRGTMQNTIVVRTARALRTVGLATLRFNFRGVGASEGAHDGQGEEERDAAAGLELLQERFPGAALWAAGYSFGARTVVGLAVREARIRRLFLVALPIIAYPCEAIRRVLQPTRVLFGAADEFGTLAAFRARFPDLGPNVQAAEIPGADHFFRGCTPLVEEAIREWAIRAVREEP